MTPQVVTDTLDVVVTVIECVGALIIATGAAVALVRFLTQGFRDRDTEVFVSIRLTLGRFLALGLEFQLAGDVLRTAVAPNFREIGQLASIAAIRTLLNFFLGKEVENERAQLRTASGRSTPSP